MKLFSFSPKQLSHSAIAGMGFIIACALVAILLEITTLNTAIQVATTLVAMLVSSVCLLHIYQEHQKSYKKEQQLKHHVIEKILLMYPPSNRKQVQEHLERALETHGLQQRLQKLTHYHQSTKSLHAFIHRFRRLEATKHTLRDLGLCWEQKR